ncbi:N-lysine methyltransferase KMT5A-like isoform X2 [Crassostrea virginica]
MELRKKKPPGPESNALFWCREGKDPPGFKIKNFTKKGRGIVTCKKFDKGDFLLEYVGERISLSEGDRRENIFSSGFRYFLKTFCIDATEETNRLCRLVNHGEKKERNAKMKLIEENKLCLFATRDLKVGEEVLYDYGIGSNSLPWKTQYATNDPGQTNEEEPLTMTTRCLMMKWRHQDLNMSQKVPKRRMMIMMMTILNVPLKIVS